MSDSRDLNQLLRAVVRLYFMAQGTLHLRYAEYDELVDALVLLIEEANDQKHTLRKE